MSEVLFLSKDDIRSQNRELAFKMVFREIVKACREDLMSISASGSYPRVPFRDVVAEILKRWNISEQEIGTTLSLAIEFPADVARNQWFIGPDGKPVAKFIEPKKEVPAKKKSKKKVRK